MNGPGARSLEIAVNAVSATVGGAKTHLRAILPRMIRIAPHHRFTVYAPRDHLRDFEAPGAANVRSVGVDVDGLDASARLWWENARLPGLLSRSRATVVLAPSNLAHVREAGVPKVVVVHNVLPFHPEVFRHDAFAKRLRLHLLRAATRFVVRRAAGTIFLSRAGRDAVTDRGRFVPRRSAVIYHGVDREFGRGDRGDGTALAKTFGIDGPFVLAVSHLYRYKKLDALVRAFASLDPGVRGDHHVIIAGADYDAEHAAALRRQVADERLADRVHFVGVLGFEDLSRLHAAASVIAFLSVCDNCPNALLEALASGRPILASSRSVVPEIVGDAALVVDPLAQDEVSSGLASLLRSPDLAQELGERARRRSRLFDWDECAARTLGFLEDVARGRGGAAQDRGVTIR